MSVLHSVSVAAVIISDGNVLLTQRADDHTWVIPGGVLELGEDIEAGLHREVLEETGLSVEISALTGVYKNMMRAVVALVFRCRMTSGQLSINDEVINFHWADAGEVRAMASDVSAARVLDALAGRSTPAVRQHDGVHLL
jgi:8-oxo-dGTP diphosphatase